MISGEQIQQAVERMVAAAVFCGLLTLTEVKFRLHFYAVPAQ